MLIKYDRASLLHGPEGFTFRPGTNAVPTATWAQIRKHPSIRKLMDANVLSEESDFDEEMEALSDPKTLRDVETPDVPIQKPMQETPPSERDLNHLYTLKASRARHLVSETVSLGLLEGWLAREKRDNVRDSLTAQIAKIRAPMELRDRSQSRQISTGGKPDMIELAVTPGAQDD